MAVGVRRLADSGGSGWRVFVSHTSELREFPAGRSYVAAVERAIAACGHVIVDMADFPAADLTTAELCAERVRGCDVYVGLLGTRYGSPVRGKPEVSYTELEFKTATEAGLPRLVFLLDTGAAEVGIPPSRLIDLEFGALQEAFRCRVRGSGLVTQAFADPATLGQLVERSLRELAIPWTGDGRPPQNVIAAAGVAELQLISEKVDQLSITSEMIIRQLSAIEQRFEVEISRTRNLANTSRPSDTTAQVLQDRYRLIHKLGAGGMGSVWLAEDSLLGRQVALKELAGYHSNVDRGETRARAIREAQALARVRHPAIVSIYDLLSIGDDLWIVMEYISGRSLADIMTHRDQLDEKMIARIGQAVLQGLGAVHAAHVVHRDVKPANILVADDGSVSLVDFGIAQIAGDMSLTGQHAVIGTAEFLAPERLAGRTAGPSADLWSLGVTLFSALEGYSPFRRNGVEATVTAILRDDPPTPSRRGRLAEVVLRLLVKDPSQRADAREFALALQSILDG